MILTKVNCIMHRSRRGVTLIEMMIVLLLVTILLAIAIPAYMRLRESSRARACRVNLRQLQSAKERWAMDHRKTDTDRPNLEDLYPSYIKNPPSCPASGRYELRSVGEPPKCTVEGGHAIY